jgi:predicted nucleic acid-binding protein
MSEPLIVFIDSNILFSTCYRSPNLFERQWQIPSVHIVTAKYCTKEVRKNLPEPDQRRRLDEWLLKTEVVEDCPADELPESLMLPAKDVPVIAAAARRKADILITGDSKHFGRYFGHTVLGVLVESTGMFRARFPEVFKD